MGRITEWIAERSVAFEAARMQARIKSGLLTLKDKELIKLLGWRIPGDSTLSDPYQQMAPVYACITIKARNVASVPFKLYRRSKAAAKMSGFDVRSKMMLLRTKAAEGTEVTSGVPWMVFQRPNILNSRFQFWESLIIDLDGRGEWFVWKDKEQVDGFPIALWRRDPLKMATAAVNGYFSGWKYTSGSDIAMYAKEEVLHDRYSHPNDEIRGLSPLVPLGITLEAMYDGIRWNRAFFKNNATPDIAYTTDKDLTSVQRKELTHALQAARENMTGAHKSILLEGGLKPVPLSFTQKDMQFGNLMQMSKDEVCMALHVPKSVLSMYEDANYAFALSADRGFWSETLLPLMTRAEDEFNRSLLHPAGLEGYFDLQAVDALNYAWLDKIDAAVKLWGLQFTANEINERLNLGFEEQPWRDHPAVPMGAPDENGEQPEPPAPTAAPPVADTDADDEEDVSEAQDDAEPAKKASMPRDQIADAMRERRWRDAVAKVRPLVGKMNRDLKNYWHDVERKVMDRITKGNVAAIAVQKGISADNLDALDSAFSDDTLKRTVDASIKASTKLGVETTYKGDFKLVSPGALARAGKRVGKIVGINEVGREQLKDAIAQTIKDAAEQGMSEATLAELIFSTAKGQLANMENRSRTQARTEVHGAYAEGRWAGMKKSGATRKVWLSSRDDLVRDTHAEMEGVEVAFDEQFDLPSGVKMMFPMDPDADGSEQEVASETINCRCVLAAVYEDEAGDVSMDPPDAGPPPSAGPVMLDINDIVDVKTATDYFDQQKWGHVTDDVTKMVNVPAHQMDVKSWGPAFNNETAKATQARLFANSTDEMVKNAGLKAGALPEVKNIMITDYRKGGRCNVNGDAIVSLSFAQDSAYTASQISDLADRAAKNAPSPRWIMGSEAEMRKGGWAKYATRHEWGHRIDGSRGSRAGNMWSFSPEFDAALTKSYGSSGPRAVMNNMSEYAASSQLETFAEGWAAYTSPFPETRSLLPDVMIKFFDKVAADLNAVAGGTP